VLIHFASLQQSRCKIIPKPEYTEPQSASKESSEKWERRKQHSKKNIIMAGMENLRESLLESEEAGSSANGGASSSASHGRSHGSLAQFTAVDGSSNKHRFRGVKVKTEWLTPLPELEQISASCSEVRVLQQGSSEDVRLAWILFLVGILFPPVAVGNILMHMNSRVAVRRRSALFSALVLTVTLLIITLVILDNREVE
jgi:hypothetical protein